MNSCTAGVPQPGRLSGGEGPQEVGLLPPPPPVRAHGEESWEVGWQWGSGKGYGRLASGQGGGGRGK